MRTVALTIAGVDPSGGAGIAADLKTFHQHGVYGCAVVTLITVQNTQSLRRVEVLSADLIAQQLDSVLEDITPQAIKTGALGSLAAVKTIAARLAGIAAPLVIDPVRLAKHDRAVLLDSAARSVLIERLLPSAALITANADEAAWLGEQPVRDRAEALRAGERLLALGARAALVKGGHLGGPEATDLLFIGGEVHALVAPRLAALHTHGVGCTLASAITANLALGMPLVTACTRAKHWIGEAIAGAPGVGHGICAVDHLAPVPPPGEA